MTKVAINARMSKPCLETNGLSGKCLLLSLSAKHPPIKKQSTNAHRDDEDDDKDKNNAGVFARPVASFQELVDKRLVRYFVDDRHGEWFE